MPPSHRSAPVFDTVAPAYDVWARLYEQRTKRLVVERAALEGAPRVLDVGVGTADCFMHVASANTAGHHVGVDLSMGMLRRARGRISGSLACASAAALPFVDASFDRVISTYLVDLLAPGECDRAVQEWVRVLRPQGLLVIAGVTPPRRLRQRPMCWLLARHPAWAGGFDVARVSSTLAALGLTVDAPVAVEEAFVPSAILVARKATVQVTS
jgi:ubiquinone/menaquinone biosynthesis C-methylase UbiE